MSKKGGQIAIILIIAVWVLCFWKFGFSIIAGIVAFIGTCFICAAVNGSLEAKSQMYLSNKYSEEYEKK